MKKQYVLLWLFCVVSLFLEANVKIKVACIGGSITFGAGIVNRVENSYPAQLQSYLGNDYVVENFGISESVILSNDECPYANKSEYKASLEFNPDIVFIKLGSYESTSHKLGFYDGCKSNYQKIIDSYMDLESKPRIILVIPFRNYLTDEKVIPNSYLKEQITPIVEDLAYENDIEIFDGHSLFGSEYVNHIMPDKLHPSSVGAGIIAENLYRLLTVDEDCNFDVFDELKGGTKFNFHGFKGCDYSQDGFNFKITQPKIVNKKHSWVLRSKLAESELQLDKKLLELGFHIAYCDVPESFNLDSAVEKRARFYEIMAESGLNNKVVDHHPHPFTEPASILKFILKAEGLYENICIKPIRGNEFRAGAGWRNGADWNQAAADITATLKQQNIDILMLGNSITQGFSVNRKLVGSCKNNMALKEIFNGLIWESAGISGDKTQNLLWRVKNGDYNSAKPKYATIAIGVNNVDDDVESIYEGIFAVTDAALDEFPTSKIILFGMLPTASSEEWYANSNKIINKLQDATFDNRVLFVDPRECFIDEKGVLRSDLYRPDFIHINDKGYKVWAELIMDTINSIK